MIYIAHRGLFEGYNEERENHPDQIRAALAAGFDVELDVRLIGGKWWLGHDRPDHEVDDQFLLQNGLWIHCKNFEALVALRDLQLFPFEEQPNYFWHQNDDFTLTSGGFIWTYPGKPVDPRCGVLNQPEWTKGWSDDVNFTAYGVCSKFVGLIRDLHRASRR